MLYEIKNVQQEEGGPFCRWFADREFDLFVWYNPDDTFYGFQLCYQKDKDEKALTWKEKSGFVHEKVDIGSRERSNVTPILVSDGVFPKNRVAELFQKKSEEIDPVIARFVYKKILEFRI
jgi:hypothetical protein